jgi:hypothetical protein
MHTRPNFFIPRALALAALALALTALAACSGEDRPGVVTVDDAGNLSGSVSNSGVSGSVSGDAGLYRPVSDVEGYFNLPLDRTDMLAAIAEGDWATARTIYENGKNSPKSDGTVRTFRGIATDPAVLAVFPGGADAYGTASFIDTVISAGLDATGPGAGVSDAARRQLVDKGLQMAIYGKALAEVEAARVKLAAGNTDDASGAPHNVDEGAAIVIGAANAEGVRAHSVLATARSREGNFSRTGLLADPMVAEWALLLATSRSGNEAAFEASAERVRGYLNTIFYLASLRYGASALSAATDEQSVPLNEGWAFYQAIRGTVASADPAGAAHIDALYRSAPGGVPATIVEELYAILNAPAVREALGVPATLVIEQPPA